MVSGDEIALLVSGLKQDKQGEIFSSSLAKVIRGGLPLARSPMSPGKRRMVSRRRRVLKKGLIILTTLKDINMIFPSP